MSGRRMNEKTNVMLITIDCLRADHMSCLGYHRKTTPNIDKFARKGILFTQAIANSSFTPGSFPSILTSTYPFMFPDHPRISLRVSIAEILKKKGYKTAAFHSNPYLSRYYNYDKGFDYFEDFLFTSNKKELNKEYDNVSSRFSNRVTDIIKKNKKLYSIVKKIYKPILNIEMYIKQATTPYQRATIINEKVISWLEKNTSSGFFIWLHYMDTHHPFIPPKEFCNSSRYKINRAEYIISRNPPEVSKHDIQNIINLYDCAIKYVDQALANLFKEMNELDVFDNTFIIIAADHGEEFGEHGGFSHRGKLYDELIRVPLIFKAPELPSGIKIDEQVSLLNIAPTILDYLNLTECENFMGKSLLPLIADRGSKWHEEEGVISERLTKDGEGVLLMKNGDRLISCRTKSWKFIINVDRGNKELYNLEDDPHETENIYEKEKRIAEIFEEKITEHLMMEERARRKIIEKERIKNVVKRRKMI